MKYILILLLCLPFCGFGQNKTFSYSDSKFEIDAIHTTHTLSYAYWKRPENHDSLILNGIKDFLLTHPKLSIEVGVYTGFLGNEKYNLSWSSKQAEYIKNWVINSGVNSNQLNSIGYGEQNLLFTEKKIQELKLEEDKEKAHRKNNRIEFKIIQIN